MTITKPVLVGGAVILVALAAFWLSKKGNAAAVGSAIGGAAVDTVVGVAAGVGNGVAQVANDANTNPLYDFGHWLGGVAYDVTHPSDARVTTTPLAR